MDNDFDAMCRFLMKRLPTALLAWLLGLRLDEFTFVTWLDTQNIPYPGHPAGRCDIVAQVLQVREYGRPWAMLTEFQTLPDFHMPLRVASYLCAVGQTLRPTNLPGDRFALGAVVVHLTGTAPVQHRSAWDAAGTAFVVQPRVVHLASLSAARVLDEIAADETPFAVLGLIPLLQGGDDAMVVERWLAVAERVPTDLRPVIADAARLFADLTDCRPLWVARLKEWNVVRSEQANEWRAEGRKEGHDAGLKTGLDRGKLLGAYEFALENGHTVEQTRAFISQKYGPQALAQLDAELLALANPKQA
jgi:hypothetical protein